MIPRKDKVYAFVTSIVVLLFSTCAFSASVQNLTILNWSEYVSPELVEKFENQFNAKVHLVTFNSDDNRDQILLSTNGEKFDVVLVDGDSVQGYVRRGWLAKISEQEIPNSKYIVPKWGSAYEGVEGHAIPYFWGTVGIAYRADLVGAPITSWMDIMKPAEELHGKIFMLAQSRELIDIGLKAAGYSVNSAGDPNAYKRAREVLLAQKQYVKKYDVLAVNETSALVSGEIIAASTYSGDALTIQQFNENVKFVVPSEGGILWVDYLVVMAKSTKKKLAMDFINFLNEPQHAAEHAQYMYYATPNAGAEKLLPKEFLTDPVIYPTNEIMEKCEIGKKLPARVYKKRNTIFMEVTRDKI